MPTTLPSRTPKARHIVALIAALLVVMFSAAAALCGAGLLFAESKKTDGFYEATPMNMHTTAFALRDDEFEAAGGALVSQLYGELKLQVEGVDKPVFVGIARKADVEAYLRDSAHTILTDLDFETQTADARHTSGTTVPARPGDQDIWVASAEGAGTRTLTWDVEDGDWSVVVMNADGSLGVDANVGAGLSMPLVETLGIGLSAGGSVLVLIVLATATVVIRRRRRRSSPAGSASAA